MGINDYYFHQFHFEITRPFVLFLLQYNIPIIRIIIFTRQVRITY